MDLALLLVAAALLVSARRSTSPNTSRASTSILDVEALARGLASEASAGSYTVAERTAVGWGIVNGAAATRRSIYSAGGGGDWGAQGERGADGVRSYSTRLSPKPDDYALARVVLAGGLDPISGARSFFEPKVQDIAFARAEAYRADPAAYPEWARFAGYKVDAAGLRARWASKGLSLRAVVGRWEFWG